MLIEIHSIQNHSPANLNRDDLGAPKTCYFGGVLRSRLSSQCIKRSIRMSEYFAPLRGGVATRKLAQLIAGESQEERERVVRILGICGIAPKDGKAPDKDDDRSAGRVYTTWNAVAKMASALNEGKKTDKALAEEFASIIAEEVAVPDMALCGRMLEPKKAKKATGKSKDSNEEDEAEEEDSSASKDKGPWGRLELTVEASLQVAHAISTHEARPEVDYFVAADDIPGDDAGAAYLDEAMFSSACFYKYFSINWENLLENLSGFDGNKEQLAAHTVGAFLRAAALTNPTGKQNSFAAHNPPAGILVEIKDTPISYANAFAAPVPSIGERDLVSQSIAQLGQFVHDLDTGFGKPGKRFWFSSNLQYSLVGRDRDEDGKYRSSEIPLADKNLKSFDDLVEQLVASLGYDWKEVQKVYVCNGEKP